MGTDQRTEREIKQGEKHPVVYLRTDGNETIASGHLMRCLTIGRQLFLQGAFVGFILSDEKSENLLRSFYTEEERLLDPYQIVVLHSDYEQMEEELEKLLPFLAARTITCILVDSYYVTPRYLAVLKQLTRTAYLDDIYAFDYPVDLLINYDLTVPAGFYTQAGKLLTGGAYAPLRQQFSQTNFQVYRRVKNILLTTGATDDCNVAGNLLAVLEKSRKDRCIAPKKEPGASGPLKNSDMPCLASDFICHVVVGSMNAHKEKLTELARQASWIILHENVSDMAALMADCDLAVSAGGTTLYELCAVGVPTISFCIADNQLPAVTAFAGQGLIPYGGDARTDTDFYARLLEQIHSLAADFPARKEYSIRMRSCVDGAGALRIARELLEG